MIAHYLHKIKTLPPQVLVKRALAKLGRGVKELFQSTRDGLWSTRLPAISATEGWRPLAALSALDLSALDRHMAENMLQMWLQHRFDLLGSGWVECGFYDNAPGFEGCRYAGLTLDIDDSGQWLEKVLPPKDLAASRGTWRMVSKGYQPIDWQKDFKCGHRWNAAGWYRKQRVGIRPGADIKMPWELGRLQHLPRLAVFSGLFPERRDELRLEFRNQCLDFMAQNPPRMGVNWACTMDVGIRAANLALAWSLFSAEDDSFDPEFKGAFFTSITEHCHHIYTNLEWSEALTANHYLADIAGLLFAASILPPSPRRETWLNFAQDQLLREIIKQFYESGENFEASTAYHRLSGEMAVYSAALILGLTGASLPPEISTRLMGAAIFGEAVTRPDQSISQIGDNDSGLFFRLSPTGEMMTAAEAARRYASLAGYAPRADGEAYADENMNDARPFIAAASGLFQENIGSAAEAYPLEKSLAEALADGQKLERLWQPPPVAVCSEPNRDLALPFHRETVFESGTDLHVGLCHQFFPDFGVYVFRSPALYLLVNGSDLGQKGNGGHAHNDQLSFELILEGRAMVEDPGAYVYTASAELRNRYRGTRAHSTLYSGREQNEFLGPFAMKEESKCRLLAISSMDISLLLEYSNFFHRRHYIIEKRAVRIIDDCSAPFWPDTPAPPKTAGYGKLLRIPPAVLSR